MSGAFWKSRKDALRKVLFTLVVILIFVGIPASIGKWTDIFAFQQDKFSYVEIWTNRANGSHYTERETIVIFFKVMSPASQAVVTVIDNTPDTTQYLIRKITYTANQVHFVTKQAQCPDGLEIIEIQANISRNSLPSSLAATYTQDIHLKDSCFFYIDPPCSEDQDRDGFHSPHDCDDTNPFIHPGVTEVCDDEDNDCDGLIDEGCYTCIIDWDGDSFPECNDCNDNDYTVYPGAEEICDQKDNDCDGLIDEEFCQCYNDNDLDGYSDCWDPDDCNPVSYPGSPYPYTPGSGCTGYIDKHFKCHYAELWIHKKCDSYVNDGETIEIYFRINSSASTARVTITDYPPKGEPVNLLDGKPITTNKVNTLHKVVLCPAGLETLIMVATVTIDGETVTLTGDCSFRVVNCRVPDADGDGYISIPKGGDDCNDDDAAINPGAQEVCDNKDNDCDGSKDEGFPDNDYDGIPGCAGDCDDNDPNTYPRAREICDGKDNDCDGSRDEGFPDKDQDGYAVCGGDCDDTDPGTNPGAQEVDDGKDNDCDGEVDEKLTMDLIDNDGDGYSLAVDCNDNDPTVGPGIPELCSDLKDNDCDGFIDCDDDGCAEDSACQKGVFERVTQMIQDYKPLLLENKFFVIGGLAGLIAVITAIVLFRRRKKIEVGEPVRVYPTPEPEEETPKKEKRGLFGRGKKEPEVTEVKETPTEKKGFFRRGKKEPEVTEVKETPKKEKRGLFGRGKKEPEVTEVKETPTEKKGFFRRGKKEPEVTEPEKEVVTEEKKSFLERLGFKETKEEEDEITKILNEDMVKGLK